MHHPQMSFNFLPHLTTFSFGSPSLLTLSLLLYTPYLHLFLPYTESYSPSGFHLSAFLSWNECCLNKDTKIIFGILSILISFWVLWKMMLCWFMQKIEKNKRGGWGRICTCSKIVGRLLNNMRRTSVVRENSTFNFEIQMMT